MTAIGYIFLVAVLSSANAQYKAPSRALQGPERPAPIAYTLQLPRLQNPVPFYNPEITSDLQPPSNNYNIPVVFYEVPAPSQDLQVPNVEPWNPTNDESYYYGHEYPIVQNEYENPTNSHPKKYNKDVHEKYKVLNSNPKSDSPTTIDQDDLEQQRKTLERFNKLENKKQLHSEKAQSSV